MKAELKVGDKVETTPRRPFMEPLVFIIDRFSIVYEQKMACGSYGCFAINLIKKSRKKL